MKPNNKLRIVSAKDCKDCSLFQEMIEECIENTNLKIEIEKIDATSDEAIDLSIDFDINSIPFAVYKNKYIVFSDKLTKDQVKELFL